MENENAPRLPTGHPAQGGRAASAAWPALRGRLTLAALLAVGLAGCGPSDRAADRAPAGRGNPAHPGTLVVATAADPDNLFPPLVLGLEALQVTDLVYEPLALPGRDLNTLGDQGFIPRLAARWVWDADSLGVTFTLRRARWQDSVPVTARDVVYTVRTYLDTATGSPQREALGAVGAAVARNDSTVHLAFRSRDPEAFYQATAGMRILPAHLLDSIPNGRLRQSTILRSPVGSGPYRLESWDPEVGLRLVGSRQHWAGRPAIDTLVWRPVPDPSVAAVLLEQGEVDLMENVRQGQVPVLSRAAGVHLERQPGFDYAFVLFNLRDPSGRGPHPLFGERELRRALSRLVDREQIVRAMFGDMAVVSPGPFTRAMPTAGPVRDLPFDSAGGRRTLDSLGWTERDADGIRRQGHTRLEFRLLVPTSSVARQRVAVALQALYRQHGVGVVIRSLDPSAMLALQGSRRFDAVFGSWHTDPSPNSFRLAWTSAGAHPGGLNYGSYAAPGVDSLVEAALEARTPAARRSRFALVHQRVVEDAPALWMYEPWAVTAMAGWIGHPPLRADGWWLSLGEWTAAATAHASAPGAHGHP